jgi:hypothetical protein
MIKVDQNRHICFQDEIDSENDTIKSGKKEVIAITETSTPYINKTISGKRITQICRRQKTQRERNFEGDLDR